MAEANQALEIVRPLAERMAELRKRLTVGQRLQAELVSIGPTDLRQQEQVTNQTRHSGNLLACLSDDFDVVLP